MALFRNRKNSKSFYPMDSLIEKLCCFLIEKKNRHFFINPKLLPCCGQTACDKCIIQCLVVQQKTNLLICPFCNASSGIELINDERGNIECKLKPNHDASRALEKNLIDINNFLINKMESAIKQTEERFDDKEVYLKKRQKFLFEEIHIQVESLKAYLDELEVEMKEQLNASCHSCHANMEIFEKNNRYHLVDMITELENLKINAKSFERDNENQTLTNVLQKQSMNRCLTNISELNRLNRTLNEMTSELKFSPNPDLPNRSIIGSLKSIKEINLVEMLKNVKAQSSISKIKCIPNSNQLMPITPRYMCIMDQYNYFFTDSQQKQIVQLSLDSGDFIKSSHFEHHIIKNPDGICIDRKGHIFITDSELNLIFKLDLDFNLIKKFGSKDLKWPRGIAYDLEENESPNRLYVCDYSNSRVAIYNDHEQYRDDLIIPLTDTHEITKHSESESVTKFCPLNVYLTKYNVYVTDDWTGGNCIRIFDKKTRVLIKNVSDLNAWNPLGLIIDDYGNMFTTARLYYETGNTHLFCFDKNGELLYKTNLNVNSELITEIILDKITDRNNMRLICCGDKKIHYFGF